MNICVAGTGYVGLVTGAVFADLGNDVICVDKDDDKIAALSAGRMPIYEPGLEEMVARNAADRRLAFTTELGAAVRRSEIVFIAVGTPSKRDGETDLGAVEAVAKAIGQAMERYTVIVNKSTVPVGTGEFVRDVITRHQARRVPFDVVSNPAFLQAGLGFGGSCFPKDADSLVHTAARLGYDFRLLRAVVEVNRERPQHFVENIAKVLAPLDDKVVGVLGLAFKANTDDMREA